MISKISVWTCEKVCFNYFIKEDLKGEHFTQVSRQIFEIIYIVNNWFVDDWLVRHLPRRLWCTKTYFLWFLTRRWLYVDENFVLAGTNLQLRRRNNCADACEMQMQLWFICTYTDTYNVHNTNIRVIVYVGAQMRELSKYHIKC